MEMITTYMQWHGLYLLYAYLQYVLHYDYKLFPHQVNMWVISLQFSLWTLRSDFIILILEKIGRSK